MIERGGEACRSRLLGRWGSATARFGLLVLAAAAGLVLPAGPALAYYPDDYAYVVHTGVSVVSLATNTVVKQIGTNTSPRGLAINPGGTRAYVGQPGTRQVLVFDTFQDTLLTTIDNVGPNPKAMAVDPNGQFLYVVNPGYPVSTLSVISIASNTVVATITVGASVNWETGYLAFDPAGSRLYVSNYGASNVSVIDTASNTVIGTIPVAQSPEGVAINADGTRLYVTSYLDDTVSVVDLGTSAIIATIGVGDSPQGVTVNPAGTRAYVANSYSGTVSVIDVATNAVVASMVAGYGVQAIAFNPDNPAVGYYIREASGGALYRFDTATNTMTGYVAVGSNPSALAVGSYGA